MPPVQMSPPFKKRKLARSSTLEDELDVNDDDDDDVDAPSWLKLFNLDHRAGVMPTGGWVPQSKEIAYNIKSRDVKHVLWWDVSRLHPSPVDMYRLAHLTLGECPDVGDKEHRGQGTPARPFRNAVVGDEEHHS